MPTISITGFGAAGETVFGPYPDIATLQSVIPAVAHGGKLASIGPNVGAYVYVMSMNGIWNSVGLPQLAADPPYVKGFMFYNTTLSKIRVGGATAWETVTSA